MMEMPQLVSTLSRRNRGKNSSFRDLNVPRNVPQKCSGTLIVALCALLSACGTAGAQPDKATTQKVDIEVATPCAADAGPKPALADPKAFADAVARSAGIYGAAQSYAAGIQQLFDYQARLEAANAGCRTPAK